MPPAAGPGAHKYVVMALDRKDGRVVWERVAREETPHEAAHQEWGTWASPSIVTDGTHVIASFESRGIYAFDMKGTPVWKKDLGDKKMRNPFGEGSSPALHGNTLVIVWDHQGESFIVALDKRTGAERWRVVRDEIDTWATPLVVEVNGRAQVVTSGMKQVRELRSRDRPGRLARRRDDDECDPVAGGRRGPGDRDGRLPRQQPEGDSPRRGEGRHHGTPALVWSLDRDTPYVPSPLLYDGILYLLKSNNGILSVFDAKTGKPHYQLTRLEAAPERLRLAGRRRRPRLHPKPERHDGGAEARPDLRGAGGEQARRRLQRLAGARRQRALSARLQGAVQHRGEVT